jgi:Na+/H+-dicarboxylate symporter
VTAGRTPNLARLARVSGSPWLALGSILAGIALGRWAPALAGRFGAIEEVYLTLLKMLILPFLVATMVFSLRRMLADPAHASILPRVAGFFIVVFAAVFLGGFLVVLLVAPGRHLSREALLAMGHLARRGMDQERMALFAAPAPAEAQSLARLLWTLIPSNIFAALSQGETLKVFSFSLLFGLALGKAKHKAGDTLADILESVFQACLTLTEWFNLMLPLVLVATFARQTARSGLEPFLAMSRFCLCFLLATLALLAAGAWVLHRVTGRSWREVLRSQRQPVLLAIATRSSPACMPSMTARLVEDLGCDRARTELLVPLGVSLLRIGPAFYFMAATLFIAQLYSVSLGPAQLGMVLAGSVLCGFASAGMTSTLMLLSLCGLLCGYLGLPFEAAMALFMAVDPLTDTLVSVMAVMAVDVFAVLAGGPGPRPAKQPDV